MKMQERAQSPRFSAESARENKIRTSYHFDDSTAFRRGRVNHWLIKVWIVCQLVMLHHIILMSDSFADEEVLGNVVAVRRTFHVSAQACRRVWQEMPLSQQLPESLRRGPLGWGDTFICPETLDTSGYLRCQVRVESSVPSEVLASGTDQRDVFPRSENSADQCMVHIRGETDGYTIQVQRNGSGDFEDTVNCLRLGVRRLSNEQVEVYVHTVR